MFEHWLRATVPREPPEAAAPQTRFRVSGFARVLTAAIVEGEVCGNWLGGAMRSRGRVDGQRPRSWPKRRLGGSTRADGWPRQSRDVWLYRQPTEGVNPANQLFRPAEHLAVLCQRPKSADARRATPKEEGPQCRRPAPRRARAPGARLLYEACASRSRSPDERSNRSRSPYNWTRPACGKLCR